MSFGIFKSVVKDTLLDPMKTVGGIAFNSVPQFVLQAMRARQKLSTDSSHIQGILKLAHQFAFFIRTWVYFGI